MGHYKKEQSRRQTEKNIMHQSFASPAALGPGNSGAFKFSIFKAPVKARPRGVRFVVKIPAESPCSPEGDNNVEQ